MNGPADIATFEERNVRLTNGILTFDGYVRIRDIATSVGTFHAPADSDTYERCNLIHRKWGVRA